MAASHWGRRTAGENSADFINPHPPQPWCARSPGASAGLGRRSTFTWEPLRVRGLAVAVGCLVSLQSFKSFKSFKFPLPHSPRSGSLFGRFSPSLGRETKKKSSQLCGASFAREKGVVLGAGLKHFCKNLLRKVLGLIVCAHFERGNPMKRLKKTKNNVDGRCVRR